MLAGMEIRKTILGRIEAYLAATGISAKSLQEAAGVHGDFVTRLRGGAGVSLSSIERLEKYLAANPVAHAVADGAAPPGSATADPAANGPAEGRAA